MNKKRKKTDKTKTDGGELGGGMDEIVKGIKSTTLLMSKES